MKVADYSKAVFELVNDGMSGGDAIEKLKSMLVARGHQRLYPKILRGLQELLTKQEHDNRVTATVAHDKDATKFKKEIENAAHTIGGAVTGTVVDPTIVGGYIVSRKEKQIDASYKKRLLALYRSVTK